MTSTSRRKAQEADLRDQPAYGLAEAARYLKLPSATLRSWVAGRSYPRAEGQGRFAPLIHPPAREPTQLSFWNLIEAHVLRALRTDASGVVGDPVLLHPGRAARELCAEIYRGVLAASEQWLDRNGTNPAGALPAHPSQ